MGNTHATERFQISATNMTARTGTGHIFALCYHFLKKMKAQYGDPIALVHDMGKGILSAVSAVFPDIPDFICHFHFLRDIGIHWTLDTTEQLEGYGFPFDCPHVVFYQRLKILYGLVDAADYSHFDKRFFNLWRPLNKIMNDQQLTSSIKQIEKKMVTFRQLRKALSITVSQDNKGLNDDGEDTDIKSIEEKVKQFRDKEVVHYR